MKAESGPIGTASTTPTPIEIPFSVSPDPDLLAEDARQPYPPFKEEDWRDLAGSPPDHIWAKAQQLTREAWHDHIERHTGHVHPFCAQCERRSLEANEGAVLTERELDDRLMAAVQRGPQSPDYKALRTTYLDGFLDFGEIGDATETIFPNSSREVLEAWLAHIKGIEELEYRREQILAGPARRAARWLWLHGRQPDDPWPDLGEVVSDAPRLTPLDEFLAEADEDAEYLIEGLLPTGGRFVLSAQNKAGKTTLIGNLLRSLADGDPFLDTFATVDRPLRIVLLDNELDERMLRRWLRAHGIVNADAIEVLALRGRLSSFNILDPVVRKRWAELLGPADILIFDCLRPALDALGLSEDKDAGRFLEALDELTTTAGIEQLGVVHHMGHQGERSRGDSRILDWPDAVWKLVRQDADDPMSPRYFSAYGRDVDQSETLLAFDPATRHLAVAGGSRSDTKAGAAIPDALAFLAEAGPKSQRGIEDALAGMHTQKAIRLALRLAVEAGQVTKEKGGRGGGFLYSLPTALVRQSSSQRTDALDEKCVSASIEDALRTHSAPTAEAMNRVAEELGGVIVA